MSEKNKYLTKLNINYSVIQGFYWMAFSIVIGYASVYLLDKQYTNSQIGVIFALGNILAVILQPLASTIVDQKRNITLRHIVITFLACLVVLSLLLTSMDQASTLLSISFVLLLSIFVSLHPFINSLSFIFENKGIQINFGLARGIGSVSYAIMAVIIGNLLKTDQPTILPYIKAVLFAVFIFFIFTYRIPTKGQNTKSIIHQETSMEDSNKIEIESLSILQFALKYKKFMVFLLGAVCVFLSHNVINSFFIQIITEVGGDSADMGNAISLAAVVELPAMLFFVKLKKYIKCSTLLKISGIVFALKHMVTLFATNVTMIYVAQCLQFLGFGLFLPAAVYYVSIYLDKKDMVKGQSCITMAITLGAVFASVIGGPILDIYNPKVLLAVTGVITIIGAILMFGSVENSTE